MHGADIRIPLLYPAIGATLVLFGIFTNGDAGRIGRMIR